MFSITKQICYNKNGDYMFHISDIRKYDKCINKFYYSKSEPIKSASVINYNYNLKDMYIKYLNIKDYYVGQRNDQSIKAISALNDYDYLVDARFEYKDLRVTIGLMEKKKTGFNVYFFNASVYPRESDSQSIADTLWVLNNCNVNINKVYVVHLNGLYIKKGNYDLNKLILVNSYLYNDKNKLGKSIKELVDEKYRDLTDILIEMKMTLISEVAESNKSKHCRKSRCIYINNCFDISHSDVHSVLNLIQCNDKYKIQEQGIDTLNKLDLQLIEGTRNQYAQVYASKSDDLFFDYFAVKHWMDMKIKQPLSFLDFEWDTFAFPPYDGMRPYYVLCFQYSLHIDDNNKLKHYQYIGENDCREEFIQSLLRDIPESGSIIVYNMEGGEKLRLTQLAEQFPKYKEDLLHLCDRMVDLSLPFTSGNIYDLRMRGQYSLKTLAKIFCNFDYNELAISNGMEAVIMWRNINNLDGVEKDSALQELYEYCSKDTYFMYELYYRILDILKEKEIKLKTSFG